MKKIDIETAENSPQHLSYRKRINNSDKVVHGEKYFDHHYYKTWKHIYRFIEKYVGKSWDLCYSDFLNKFIKQERTMVHTRNNLVWQFREHFSNFGTEYFATLYDFKIDDNGIIHKQYSTYKKEKTPLYKEYIYKYKHSNNKYWDFHRKSDFALIFGTDILSLAIVGLSEEKYEKAIYKAFIETGKNYSYYFEKIPVGEPVSDEDKPKVLKEKMSKKRKYQREIDKMCDDNIVNKLIGRFSESKEEQKAKKRLAKDMAKKEEEKNIIDRDRLGFDSTSFKTPQKFSNKS